MGSAAKFVLTAGASSMQKTAPRVHLEVTYQRVGEAEVGFSVLICHQVWLEVGFGVAAALHRTASI